MNVSEWYERSQYSNCLLIRQEISYWGQRWGKVMRFCEIINSFLFSYVLLL